MKWIQHRYGTERQTLYNFQSIAQTNDDYAYLVCISERDRQIINTAISNADTLPSRVYADKRAVDYYLCLEREDTQYHQFTEFIDQLKGRLQVLHCVSDIVDAINNLSLSVEQAACCGFGGGAGGAGQTQEPATTYTDDGQTPPTGYGTYAAYKAEKCQVAHAILTEIQSAMSVLSAAGLAELAATVLATTLLTPIPFDELAGLAAAAVAMLYAGTIATYTTELDDAIGNDLPNLRCILYAADSVGQARANLKSAMSLSSLAEMLLDYFLTNDSLNRLFAYGDIGDYGADCTTCGQSVGVVMLYGNLIDRVGDVVTLASGDAGGYQQISWIVNQSQWQIDPNAIKAKIISYSIVSGTPGDPPHNGWSRYQGYYWPSGSPIYVISENTLTVPSVYATRFDIIGQNGGSQFVVQVELENE